MKITEKEIEGKKLFVIDNSLKRKDIEEFYNLIIGLSYRKHERDDDSDEYPIFSVDFQPMKFVQDTTVGSMGLKLLNKLKSNQYRLLRSYVNMSHYGDVEYPHRDCEIDEKDVTVLYYANQQWDYTWGGETKFYEKKDTIYSILPHAGRFVIFDGAIEHMGSIPTRICKVSRFTVAMKFKTTDE